MIPPTEKLPNCTLRPFELTDAQPLFDILKDEDVLRFMPWKEPLPLERVQRFVQQQIRHWEDHPYGWWALENLPGHEFMGWCGLQFLPETDQTEVGYLLGKKYWGKGIATEAAHASLAFGFDSVKLDRIVALVHPDNHASIRVIEKQGMERDDRIQLWGMDLDRYSITSAKYMDLKRKSL